jgi:hypothetical protein
MHLIPTKPGVLNNGVNPKHPSHIAELVLTALVWIQIAVRSKPWVTMDVLVYARAKIGNRSSSEATTARECVHLRIIVSSRAERSVA